MDTHIVCSPERGVFQHAIRQALPVLLLERPPEDAVPYEVCTTHWPAHACPCGRYRVYWDDGRGRHMAMPDWIDKYPRVKALLQQEDDELLYAPDTPAPDPDERGLDAGGFDPGDIA